MAAPPPETATIVFFRNFFRAFSFTLFPVSDSKPKTFKSLTNCPRSTKQKGNKKLPLFTIHGCVRVSRSYGVRVFVLWVCRVCVTAVWVVSPCVVFGCEFSYGCVVVPLYVVFGCARFCCCL